MIEFLLLVYCSTIIFSFGSCVSKDSKETEIEIGEPFEPYKPEGGHCVLFHRREGKSMTVVMPAMQDNYMYLLVDIRTNISAAVDPYDPELMIQEADKIGANITTILTTHHHPRHAGGNSRLVKLLAPRNITVVGGDERVEAVTKIVRGGEEFKLGKQTVKCLYTPGHSFSSISYYVTHDHPFPTLFVGDLFSVGGCDRPVEGSIWDLYISLKKLTCLHYRTVVFTGHEKGVQNLEFSKRFDSENEEVDNRLALVKALINIEQPAVPTTIEYEQDSNPCFRVNSTTEKDVVQQFNKYFEEKLKFVFEYNNNRTTISTVTTTVNTKII